MKKIFWENPYQQSLTTRVKAIIDDELLLDETIAYSFSGGQESDVAYLDGILIQGSRMENNLIYYTIADAKDKFSLNQEVKMTLDWPRRLRLMRLHFAAELILELVTQNFGLEKVGAHISETKARIDFKSDVNISTLFEALLTYYNQIIEKDYPIITGFSDALTQRRFWKIEGFAEVPCGGTHVKSTKEVGLVLLKRNRPGKSIERIEIRLENEQ